MHGFTHVDNIPFFRCFWRERFDKIFKNNASAYRKNEPVIKTLRSRFYEDKNGNTKFTLLTNRGDPFVLPTDQS